MNDYRYFSDPDLQPIFVDEKWLNSIREKMPPLPAFLFEKFTSHYLLTENDATFLTENRETALYFETLCLSKIPAKISANWLMGTVQSYLKENNLEMNQFPISASSLGELIQLVLDNTISHTIAASELFNQLVLSPETPPMNLAEKLNLFQNSDEAFLKEAIEKILMQIN